MGTSSTLRGRRSFANKGPRRLQRLQRGQLPLVEAGEALGFFAEGFEIVRDASLFDDGRTSLT